MTITHDRELVPDPPRSVRATAARRRRRRWRWGGAALAGYACLWLGNRSLRRVRGPSMLPSLWPGDLLLTVPPWLAGGPRPGDVVIADTTSGQIIKRLAAGPGVSVLAWEGHRHAAGTWHRQATRDPGGDRVVPAAADEVVLLGDHPAASTDSRRFGPVPVASIRRIALVRVRPWAWLRAHRPVALPGPRRRPTVRVVALDPDDRVLLLRVQDVAGSGATWWEAPGGGIDPGEGVFEAARRELAEETGQTASKIVDLDRVVDRHTTLGDVALVKVEHLLAARLPDATIETSGWTAAERRDIVTWRWWPPDELAATEQIVVPDQLLPLIAVARRLLA